MKKIYLFLFILFTIRSFSQETYYMYDAGSNNCISETITDANGFLEDGSGAGNYINNLNCSKLISIPGTDYIYITFDFLDLASDDIITVYKGTSSLGEKVFEGSQMGENLCLKIDGQNAFIIFYTNASNNSNGFKFGWMGCTNPVASPGPFSFQKHTLLSPIRSQTTPGNGNWGIGLLSDLDNDSDLDYIIADNDQELSIWWFENNGLNNWENWVRHTISGEIQGYHNGGAVYDVNADGYMDLIYGNAWYENSKNTDVQFTRHLYNSKSTTVHDIVLADINTTSIGLELLVMSDQGIFSWFDIPETGYTNLWDENPIIDESNNYISGFHGSFSPEGVGDIDGDGLPDIVLPDKWLKNINNGNNWREYPLNFGKSGSWGMATRSFIEDLNNDGQNDIVMAHCDGLSDALTGINQVAIFYNYGTSWNKKVLNKDVDLRGSLHSLQLADFDNDGDKDILTIEQEDLLLHDCGNGKKYWDLFPSPRWFIYENLGGENWEERIIMNNTFGGHEARIADLDKDGDIDIISKVWAADYSVHLGRWEHIDILQNNTSASSYSLVINKDGNGLGSTFPSLGTHYYPAGTTVTLNATASQGSVFSGWGGDITGTENPITITMNSSMNITAVFTDETTSISKYEYYDGNGTWDQASAFGNQHILQSFTIGNTSANEDFTLYSAKIDAIRLGNPGTLTAQIFLSTAEDKPTGSALSSGTIVANSFSDSDFSEYEIPMSSCELQSSTKYVLVISVPTGNQSNRVDWRQSGNAYSGGRNMYSTDGGVSWSWGGNWDNLFEIWGSSSPQSSYPLSVSIQGDGSVSVSPELDMYPAGTEVTITASPNIGSNFTEWTGSVTGTENPITITMNNSMNITAVFAGETPTISKYEYYDGNGTWDQASAFGNQYILQSFTIGNTSTNEDFNLYSVKIDAIRIGNPSTLTAQIFLSDVEDEPTGNALSTKTIAANSFSESDFSEYEIPMPSCELQSGTKYVLVISVPTGNQSNRVDWRQSGDGYSGGRNMYSTDGGVSWSWGGNWDNLFEIWGSNSSQNSYPLSVSIQGDGSVSVSPQLAMYPASTVVTISASPNIGSYFTEWTGSVISSVNPITITMNSPMNITAVFTDETPTISKYEYYDGNGTWDQASAFGNQHILQSFTIGNTSANENFTLYSVKVDAIRLGNPGMLTAEIFLSDAEDKPTGIALSTGETDPSSFSASVFSEYEIPMSSYELQSSTKYVLVIKALSGNSSNRVDWRQSVDAYSGGRNMYSTDGGINWSWGGNWDNLFEIWGSSNGLKSTKKPPSGNTNIYPNPFSDKLRVVDENKIVTIEIRNILGGTAIIFRNINTNSIEIDLSNLKSGFYNIRITNEFNNITIKNIMKK